MPRRERNVHDPLEGAAGRLQPAGEDRGEGDGSDLIMPEEGVIYRRLGAGESIREGDVNVRDNILIRPLGVDPRLLYVGAEAVLAGARDGSFDRPFAQLGEALKLLDREGSPVCAVYQVPDGALLHFRDPDPPFDVARYLETKNREYAESQSSAGAAVSVDSLKQLNNTNSLGTVPEDE